MKKVSILLVITAFILSCDKAATSDCADIACDLSLKYLTVTFINKDSLGVPVSGYSAINQRTKDTVYTSLSASANTTPGTFIVLDDSYRTKLSRGGDNIKVTGTYDAIKQTKSTILKVANPLCGCHFEKISGEQTVKFD
ncbi:hypothetical protein [Pedobacter sp. JCM 36344]|uniref:hypothetical protein n=1 Tax=Pedobacter sp. JCM 36344 TaxID=3374280 RepID=UPI0039780842